MSDDKNAIDQYRALLDKQLVQRRGEMFANYLKAFEGQLDRLRVADYDNLKKRVATVTALSEQAVRPDLSREAVFNRPGIVSQQIFYSTKKRWWHDPLFREVLENCIKLTVDYHQEVDLMTVEASRQQIRDMELEMSGKLAEKARAMLLFSLDDASWSFGSVAPMVKAASQLGRLALNMKPDEEDKPTARGKSVTVYLPDNGRGGGV